MHAPHLFDEEGGYDDDLDKIDQPTNIGIIQSTLNNFNKAHPSLKIDKPYENLLSITGDNIIQGTFFIKYYNEDLLAIDDEIFKIKSDVENCVKDFNSGGIAGIEKEALEQEKCLDDIYYRSVDVFYVNSKNEMLKNYMKLSNDIKENYF